MNTNEMKCKFQNKVHIQSGQAVGRSSFPVLLEWQNPGQNEPPIKRMYDCLDL